MEIGDIRRLYDIRDLLGLSARRRWINCPLPMHSHKNYTPSFSIYDGRDGVQRFKCHGNCAAQGDVIDLAGYLWVGGYSPKSATDVAKAIEALGVRGSVRIPTAEKTVVVSLGPRVHEKYLPIGETARAYAISRGLTVETIEKFKVGQDRMFMTMPYFRDGRLRGIKKRRCSGQGLRYITETGSKSDLFNIDEVKYSNEHVFIVKAELPAMLVHQWGFKAVAPTGGEGSWNEQWRVDLAMSRLTVIGDNDENGRKMAIERATKFGAALEFPPSEFKDIDQYMLAQPEEALQWIRTLAM